MSEPFSRTIGICGVSLSGPCERHQIGERRGAYLRLVLKQLIEAVFASGHGDDGEEIGAGSLNISRSIAHHADARCTSCQLPGLVCRLADELRADGEVIAKSAKAEPLAQAGLLHFDPANHLKVAGGHTEEGSAACEIVQRLLHTRHADQVKLMTMFGDGVSHCFQ